MQYNPKKSIKIAIEDLNIGMFVTGLEESQRVNLSNAGRISTQEAISQLLDCGVRFAWVDEDLSANYCVFKPVLGNSNLHHINGLKTATTPSPSVLNENSLLDSEIDKEKLLGFPQQEEQTKDFHPENDKNFLSLSSKKHKKGKQYLIDSQSRLSKNNKDKGVKQNKARKLIAEAKVLAQKLLSETFEFDSFEINELKLWADDLIQTVLVDSDAIKCVSALRNKDTYLLEHSVNVSCLLVTFGKYLGMDKAMLRNLAIGGIVHDVGKTKVDSKVLLKPDRLTPEEFEHIKLHQVYANSIIDNVKGLHQVSRDVCLMHHEKLDGSGYPNGLKNHEIPLHGRMSCIVDIYDALTAHRCYKAGMSSTEAFKILTNLTPHHLDQDLVYKFINCIGVYPVGSLVELSDGRVGITWTSNTKQPLKPIVKCFYSRQFGHFIEVVFVDLAVVNLKIEQAISPLDIEIDPAPFYAS